eukprot:2833544-Pleurochrysis_carterae.AAC.2
MHTHPSERMWDRRMKTCAGAVRAQVPAARRCSCASAAGDLRAQVSAARVLRMHRCYACMGATRAYSRCYD